MEGDGVVEEDKHSKLNEKIIYFEMHLKRLLKTRAKPNYLIINGENRGKRRSFGYAYFQENFHLYSR